MGNIVEAPLSTLKSRHSPFYTFCTVLKRWIKLYLNDGNPDSLWLLPSSAFALDRGLSLFCLLSFALLPQFHRYCVDGYMINVYYSKKQRNVYKIRDWRNSSNGLISIDAVRQIAETLILSLYCVDALRGGYLRAVVARFAESIYTVSSYCVDLTLESLTPSGLSDEPPTDWVKSD